MKIHTETDICSVCKKPFKWSKRNWVREEMIEVEFITAHASCRSKLRLLNEKKQKLQNEITNIEWEIFKMCNHVKPEIIESQLLINGIFNIKN